MVVVSDCDGCQAVSSGDVACYAVEVFGPLVVFESFRGG